MVEAQSGLNQGSDRGAGKGKDAQGRGTGGSVVLGATPAVAVGGGKGWKTQGNVGSGQGAVVTRTECEQTEVAKVTVTQGTTEAGKYRGCSATAQAVGVTAAAEAERGWETQGFAGKGRI